MKKEAFEELSESMNQVASSLTVPRPPVEFLDFLFLTSLDQDFYEKAANAGIGESLISQLMGFFISGMVWAEGHESIGSSVARIKLKYGDEAFS